MTIDQHDESSVRGEPATTEQFTRVCRKCSVQSQQTANFCPSCGAPYVADPRRKKRMIAVLGSALAVLVVVGGVFLAVRSHQRSVADEQDQRRAAAAADAKEAADAREADAADAQEAADQAERDSRQEIVKDMQKTITKDARKSVSDDLLDGPILYTQCTALGGGSTDDLTALTGTFDCLAANKENDDGTISGYRYSATATWADGSYSWRLGG